MSTIFTSSQVPGGQSWTIVSKLGHILKTATDKYGERDQSYTILGIEFNSEGHPRIWYPSLGKYIIIQISQNCINDLNRAVFQVAHEAIHCLSPTGNSTTIVLEEGLANLFSIEYTMTNGNGIWTSNDDRYTQASLLVNQLLSFDPEIIKKIRTFEPTLALVQKDLILEVNPNIPEILAENLTKVF